MNYLVSFVTEDAVVVQVPTSPILLSVNQTENVIDITRSFIGIRWMDARFRFLFLMRLN